MLNLLFLKTVTNIKLNELNIKDFQSWEKKGYLTLSRLKMFKLSEHPILLALKLFNLYY